MATYLLKSPDEDMQRWKEDASRSGVAFAVWIRDALQAKSAGLQDGEKEKQDEPVPKQDETARAQDGEKKKQAVAAPKQENSATKTYGSDIKQDSAKKNKKKAPSVFSSRAPKCSAFAPRGSKCKICGQMH